MSFMMMMMKTELDNQEQNLLLQQLYDTADPSDLRDVSELVTGDYADQYDYPAIEFANVVVFYVSPVLVVVGTVGNLISAIIMWRLSRDVMSTCFYLSALAGMDLVVLFVHCANNWLTIVSGGLDINIFLMNSLESVCKGYPFVFGFISQMSRWLVAAAAIEGTIAARYPNSATTRCTLSRAKDIMMLMTVLLVCVNIHYFWSYELVNESIADATEGIRCTFAKHGHLQSEFFQEKIWPVLHLTVAELLPTLLIMVCTSAMLKTVVIGQHRGSSAYRMWRQRYLMDPCAIDQLVVTILALCLTCLLLTLPKLISIHFTYIVGLLEHTAEFDASNYLAGTLCDFAVYMFLSCKFFVYASTSGRFRRELKSFCRLILCKQKTNNRSQNLLSSSDTYTFY